MTADELVTLDAAELTDDVDARDLDLRAVPIALLDGDTVCGPFHRPGPGGAPRLEVYEVEIRQGSRGPEEKRGGLTARVAHDCDALELLEQVGPGIWWCAVRDAAGRIIVGRRVVTGTKAQRQASQGGGRVELFGRPGPTEDKPPAWLQPLLEQARPKEPEQPPAWLQQLLAQQAAAEKREADRRDREEQERREAQRAEDKRREAELELLRQQLDERRKRDQAEAEARLQRLQAEVEALRAAPPAVPAAPSDPLAALEAELARTERLQELLERVRPADPEPEEAGGWEQIATTFGGLVETAKEGKKLLGILGSD